MTNCDTSASRVSAHASDHAIAIRDRLKEFVHGGKFFSSDDVVGLIRSMNTVVRLAEEAEDENRLLSRQAAIANHNARPTIVGGNVIAFPRT
ncbi:hypothetical protein C8J31_102117 [Rhizobium sp. PP-CC-2G-626]|nr:hypothetical protein C8J31_102117 [Rhizobium sp. PP-CC-2G-626]